MCTSQEHADFYILKPWGPGRLRALRCPDAHASIPGRKPGYFGFSSLLRTPV